MFRRVVFGICGIGLGMMIGLVAINPAVVGQDKIERREKKSDRNATLTGKFLEESPSGFKIKVGMKDETIPAAEVLRVYYDDIPATLKIPYQNIFLAEETSRDYPKLITDYKALLSKAAMTNDVKPPLKRYLEFRIAMLEAISAENDTAKAEARRDLADFINNNKASWEYFFAARTLARLYMERLDYDNAVKIMEELTRAAAIPPDLKQEAELQLVDMLFQSNKLDAVNAKLTAALADPKVPDPLKQRYKMYQIGLEAQGSEAKLNEALKKLDEIAIKSADNSLKALAYNVMGDCYMQKQKPRDAMWCYLWVDVVYFQDRAEHQKAMAKLLAIFEDEKDADKAQLYKEKLSRFKQ